ncbi:MAG: BrnA antitoxin family protein [Desulfobacteraceae bacterium]|nr:BrnA antitoxin family protein [Desulfobacteraceae bacterium]
MWCDSDNWTSDLHKQQITIMLDTVLVEYFKAKAGETDWQKLISDTLRQAVEYENLEDTLRRVVREELNHRTC